MASTQDRALIDVNVLLTVLFGRSGKEIAYRELKAHAGRACVSALTVHIFLHFTAKQYPLPLLQGFLAEFDILSLTSTDITWAFANTRDSDFEGALQLATAIRAGCSEVITFDRNLARRYADLPQLTIRLLEEPTS